MTKLSSSPARGTFGLDRMLERRLAEGRTPENDPDTAAYVDYLQSDRERILEQEQDPEWQQDNLEYDLRTTDWMLDKVRASDVYAQNLYAAMCNNDFQRLDTWPVLTDKRWSCSWRHAGGIIADMQEKGDYIDWYCSGIRNPWTDEEFATATQEQQERYLKLENLYVSESVVTDEIREDLRKLGWTVIEFKDI